MLDLLTRKRIYIHIIFVYIYTRFAITAYVYISIPWHTYGVPGLCRFLYVSTCGVYGA